MKLGLITDIHEQVSYLEIALDELERQGVDQIVVMGDLFEMGERLEETTDLLSRAGAIGVWGNHDFGLCVDVEEDLRARYAGSVLEFMARLRPRLTIEDCHFTHVEPWLNPEELTDLWYFQGIPDDAEKLARSFDALPHPIMFVGHFHRWQLATPAGPLDWRGDSAVILGRDERYLVVVGALCEGHFAVFDTESWELRPYKVPG